jgi:hypothetical protein
MTERTLSEVDEGWTDPRVRTLVERTLTRIPREESIELELAFAGLGTRRIELRARRIDAAGAPPQVLLVARDHGGGRA